MSFERRTETQTPFPQPCVLRICLFSDCENLFSTVSVKRFRLNWCHKTLRWFIPRPWVLNRALLIGFSCYAMQHSTQQVNFFSLSWSWKKHLVRFMLNNGTVGEGASNDSSDCTLQAVIPRTSHSTRYDVTSCVWSRLLLRFDDMTAPFHDLSV